MANKKGLNRFFKSKPIQERQANAFERISNKKRFDILGRKVKGETQHLGRLRTAATEKRKETLLVEYKQLKKNNVMLDRRFGEDDEALTSEEKAILRFQKQRIKDAAGGKFALPDPDDDQEQRLTHLGRSLADHLSDAPDGWVSEDDEGIDPDSLAEFHFGGGLFGKKSYGKEGDDEREEPHHRSKKEVMEEIIAKSKAYKAARKDQRDEDVAETERLDSDFRELLQNSASIGLVLKAKKEKSSLPALAEEDKRFDALTKELVFEAKAKPGQRALTAEELAEAELKRLKNAEASQKKRMNENIEDESDEGGQDAEIPRKGYAARRAKRARSEAEESEDERSGHRNPMSGDALEDDFEIHSSDDEHNEGQYEELTELEKRRQERASGSHPLQASLRGAAAKLMEKYGMAEAVVSFSEEEEKSSSSETEEESSLDDVESDEHDEGAASPAKKMSKLPHTVKASTAPPLDGSLPYTPDLPASYEEFESIAKALSAGQLQEYIRRIRVCHATSLSTGNKKAMQEVYGIVMQHYASLAHRHPLPSNSLDALLPHILELTAAVPFYAATLARARLQKAHETMVEALADPVKKAFAWPSLGTLLVVKLFTVIFPVSDKRHTVLTPASLFVTSALANCPLAHPRDLAIGLFCSSLALNMHSAAQRYCPEPLNFAATVLRMAANDEGTFGEGHHKEWLDISGGEENGLPHHAHSQVMDISTLALGMDDAHWSSPSFKISARVVAVNIIVRCAEIWCNIDALPEILQPAVDILRSNLSEQQPDGPLAHVYEQALTKIQKAVSEATTRRKPLLNPSLIKIPEKRAYNPRFEDDFALGKDYDPDRERSERRKLQRALRKEERGAVRELRRDAAFMSVVRDKEKLGKQSELDASARKAISFLQSQESDFKSGGQGGLWKKKKKKH